MHFLTLAQFAQYLKAGKWRGAIAESNASHGSHQSDLIKALQSYEKMLESMNNGDKVIVQVSNSIKSVCAVLAVWELGGVVVPVKKDLNEATVDNIARDCNARFILSPDTDSLGEIPGYVDEPYLMAWHGRRGVSGSDLALIIYTSGSTGKPKGIMLTHDNVMAAMYSIVTYLDLKPSDTILCVSPLSFDYGLYQVLFAFAVDLKVVLFNEAVQPVRLVKVLNEEAVTVFPVVPALASSLERTLKAFKKGLPHLKKLTNTGGHLNAEIISGLKQTIPHLQIFAMYGLTECKRALYLPPEDLDRKMGSVGIPMPGLEARVFMPDRRKRPRTREEEERWQNLTEEERQNFITAWREKNPEDSQRYYEAGPGEVGELFVRGASVMQGYYNAEAQGGARIFRGKYRDDNWLATGDLFSRDEEGYFYFRGRAKELIKQGAYCLYPVDIEEAIMQHGLVQLVSVVGKDDKNGLEVAFAFIQLTEDSDEHRQIVEQWIKEHMEPEYRPREIRFLSEFPVGSTGKIDKKTLAVSAV